MPPLMMTDWVLVAMDRFEVALTGYTHGFVGLWGMVLMIVGLKAILKIKTWLALAAAVVSTALTMPLVMIFAR